MKKIIKTDQAPAAIGAYSQAVAVGTTLYVSGQIPLVPETMDVVSEEISEQITQVFKNFSAVLSAGGCNFNDVVQMRIYLTDLSNFAKVNEIMAQYVPEPFPSRAAVEVSALPKGVGVEIEGIAEISV
jgi:reactive intermediate/imine deaminase